MAYILGPPLGGLEQQNIGELSFQPTTEPDQILAWYQLYSVQIACLALIHIITTFVKRVKILKKSILKVLNI